MTPTPIKNYWTKVFEICDVLQEEMKDHDKPIMNHCIDIKFDKVSELE